MDEIDVICEDIVLFLVREIWRGKLLPKESFDVRGLEIKYSVDSGKWTSLSASLGGVVLSCVAPLAENPSTCAGLEGPISAATAAAMEGIPWSVFIMNICEDFADKFPIADSELSGVDAFGSAPAPFPCFFEWCSFADIDGNKLLSVLLNLPARALYDPSFCGCSSDIASTSSSKIGIVIPGSITSGILVNFFSIRYKSSICSQSQGQSQCQTQAKDQKIDVSEIPFSPSFPSSRSKAVAKSGVMNIWAARRTNREIPPSRAPIPSLYSSGFSVQRSACRSEEKGDWIWCRTASDALKSQKRTYTLSELSPKKPERKRRKTSPFMRDFLWAIEKCRRENFNLQNA